jgi:hypothetical protein
MVTTVLSTILYGEVRRGYSIRMSRLQHVMADCTALTMGGGDSTAPQASYRDRGRQVLDEDGTELLSF